MKEQSKFEKEAKRWFNQALEDLESAKILLNNKRYYLVCFLCQQIVEKALKSVLYFNKEDLVIGHSVKKLADWAGEFDEDFKKLGEKISILDTYYITTRYPNGLPDGIPAEVFNKNIAQSAFELTEETIQAVRKYLNF
ncbi:MAG: HEPN domain-containing protein [Promethearchaeota archaeon]